MRAFKRVRGIRGQALQLSLLALILEITFTGNAAAADPPPAQQAARLSDADRKKLLAERGSGLPHWRRNGRSTLSLAVLRALLRGDAIYALSNNHVMADVKGPRGGSDQPDIVFDRLDH